MRMAAVGCRAKPAFAPRLQTARAHQSRHPFATNAATALAQLGVHARTAIGAAAGGMDGRDLA
jgi:hypothetical protein